MRVTKQTLAHDVGYLPVGTIIHMEDDLQPLVDRWVALGYAVQVDEKPAPEPLRRRGVRIRVEDVPNEESPDA